jgi:hypothetical protein
LTPDLHPVILTATQTPAGWLREADPECPARFNWSLNVAAEAVADDFDIDMPEDILTVVHARLSVIG